MSTRTTVARQDTLRPFTKRYTIGRVEAELRHSETIAEGYRELALAELVELERYGDALLEDDRRHRVYLTELGA